VLLYSSSTLVVRCVSGVFALVIFLYRTTDIVLDRTTDIVLLVVVRCVPGVFALVIFLYRTTDIVLDRTTDIVLQKENLSKKGKKVKIKKKN
jgi:hypothetical protein